MKFKSVQTILILTVSALLLISNFQVDKVGALADENNSIDSDVFNVSGVIYLDKKTGELKPAFRYNAQTTQEVRNGEYAIEFLGGNDQLLSVHRFEPVEVVASVSRKPMPLLLRILCKVKLLQRLFKLPCSTVLDSRIGGFTLRILAKDEVIAIRLTHGAQILDELRPGPQVPRVQIDQPRIKKLPNAGKFSFSWSANDPDGDMLFYRVRSSYDNQKTWVVVSSGVPFLSFSIDDLSRIPKSDHIFFQVLASDGVNTGSDVIGPFSTFAKLPTTMIISPKNGDVVQANQPIIFLGSGSDPEEENTISDERLVWSSNISGELGKGQTLQLDKGLPEGVHQIKLTVKDSDGNEASTTISLIVK